MNQKVTISASVCIGAALPCHAGIVFVDGVQQEGKVSKPKARAA
jgi:hypothetical protein